eukprot:3895129-Ditylum_brightwellii.AAC.1
MCTLSTTCTPLEGLLPKADHIWAWSGNADRLFGPTHQLAPTSMESTIHSCTLHLGICASCPALQQETAPPTAGGIEGGQINDPFSQS